MSLKSQEKNMQRLSELLGQDLTYIDGPKECGPNGAKREFLLKGGTFLRALAKDLGFRESKVWSNAAGIGSPGEVYLSGMWSAGNGLFLVVEPIPCINSCVLYRSITKLSDRTSGHSPNNFMSLRDFSSCGYEGLCARLLKMNREAPHYERAA